MCLFLVCSFFFVLCMTICVLFVSPPLPFLPSHNNQEQTSKTLLLKCNFASVPFPSFPFSRNCLCFFLVLHLFQILKLFAIQKHTRTTLCFLSSTCPSKHIFQDKMADILLWSDNMCEIKHVKILESKFWPLTLKQKPLIF